jgi:hypothetical protein
MVSSPGDKRKLRLFLIVRIVACCEGTGDALLSISAGTFAVVDGCSAFSVGRAIRDPPRTPPSQERKQARIAPPIRIIPAKNVGRRYG